MCRNCGCGVENNHWHHHGDGNWHYHVDENFKSPEGEHKNLHQHKHDHPLENHTPTDKFDENKKNNSEVVHKKITLDPMVAVLARNDQLAQQNRLWFIKNKVLSFNIISSPGSGKTLFLEKLIPILSQKIKVSVLVGDQATSLDAERLLNKGAFIKQINTPHSCHLDAPHIEREITSTVEPTTDILLIENVGNLVCPSMFDLGEHSKIAILSTTEGEDKPLKYPSLFTQASLIILTKVDLIPHLNWSQEKAIENIRRVNSSAPLFLTSAQTGMGVPLVANWFFDRLNEFKKMDYNEQATRTI